MISFVCTELSEVENLAKVPVRRVE